MPVTMPHTTLRESSCKCRAHVRATQGVVCYDGIIRLPDATLAVCISLIRQKSKKSKKSIIHEIQINRAHHSMCMHVCVDMVWKKKLHWGQWWVAQYATVRESDLEINILDCDTDSEA